MVNRKRIVIASLVFLGAFLAGSVARVDARAGVRALEGKMRAVTGPRFPAGDTLAIADTLFARCGKTDMRMKERCYEPQVLALRAQRGTRFAMGALHRLIALDRDDSGQDWMQPVGWLTLSGDFSEFGPQQGFMSDALLAPGRVWHVRVK